MTSPFSLPDKPKEIPDPITDSVGEFNLRPRWVYCEQCQYKVITTLPGPKCGKCKNYLITRI
jgi:hypothetical protein